MTTLYFILLLLGAICFIATAAKIATTRVELLALGLFFWILVPLIQTAQRL